MAQGITALNKSNAKNPVNKKYSKHEQICEEIRAGFESLINLYLSKCGPEPTKRQRECAHKRAIARVLSDWELDRETISMVIHRTVRTLQKWGI